VSERVAGTSQGKADATDSNTAARRFRRAPYLAIQDRMKLTDPASPSLNEGAAQSGGARLTRSLWLPLTVLLWRHLGPLLGPAMLTSASAMPMSSSRASGRLPPRFPIRPPLDLEFPRAFLTSGGGRSAVITRSDRKGHRRTHKGHRLNDTEC
jgi:hypothetical protein